MFWCRRATYAPAPTAATAPIPKAMRRLLIPRLVTLAVVIAWGRRRELPTGTCLFGANRRLRAEIACARLSCARRLGVIVCRPGSALRLVATALTTCLGLLALTLRFLPIFRKEVLGFTGSTLGEQISSLVQTELEQKPTPFPTPRRRLLRLQDCLTALGGKPVTGHYLRLLLLDLRTRPDELTAKGFLLLVLLAIDRKPVFFAPE